MTGSHSNDHAAVGHLRNCVVVVHNPGKRGDGRAAVPWRGRGNGGRGGFEGLRVLRVQFKNGKVGETVFGEEKEVAKKKR